MKVSRTICDLCDLDRDATQTLKFFELDKQVSRGAPAASRAYDICEYCYGEIAVFMDTLLRQGGQ